MNILNFNASRSENIALLKSPLPGFPFSSASLLSMTPVFYSEGKHFKQCSEKDLLVDYTLFYTKVGRFYHLIYKNHRVKYAGLPFSTLQSNSKKI